MQRTLRRLAAALALVAALSACAATPGEVVEAGEAAAGVESAAPTEPAAPVESAETVEPVESTEPVEPVESVESAESAEPAESAESAERAEPVKTEEPVKSEAPAEITEPVKSEAPAEIAEVLGDTVERYAEADPGDGESIAIPGYDTLVFRSERRMQSVSLINPPENACAFVMSLTLNESGETVWTGEALSPGERFTGITLTKPLRAGSYGATLHYSCYSIYDGAPLNGAEIQLMIEVE